MKREEKEKKRKKGKEYSATKIKLYSVLRSGFFYTLIAFFATFAAAAASTVVNAVELAGATRADGIKEIADLLLSAATAIITGYGAVRSGAALYRGYFNRQLIHQNTWKREVVESVMKKHTKTFEENGYRWEQWENEIYLSSPAADDALLASARGMRLKVVPHKPAMNEEQRRALYQIVSEKISQGKNIFNGNLVRLRTDMLSAENWKRKQRDGAPPCVWVQKTDYFSNMTSNDLIFDQVFEADFSSVYDGKKMTVDRYGMLYNLTDSPAANIVGASTLAVTKDRYLIINRQHNRNDVNNDCYVPSGSGSADFEDLFEQDKKEKKQLLAEKKRAYRAAKQAWKKARKDALSAGGKNSKSKDTLTAENKSKDTLTDKNENSECTDPFTAQKNMLAAKREYRYYRSMKKYECDFGAFLSRAMERELAEESHLPPSCFKETIVCGYIRLLNRGGKPDFFGITLLSCTKDEAKDFFKNKKEEIERQELKKNRAVMDFNEICNQEYIGLDQALLQPPEALFGEKKISVQLYCLLNLFKRYGDRLNLPSTEA